jgi:hypothetical protein
MEDGITYNKSYGRQMYGGMVIPILYMLGLSWYLAYGTGSWECRTSLHQYTMNIYLRCVGI